MRKTNEISNNKQIVRNLFFNIVSFGINFVISFLFTPYLIRVVGKEAYSFFPLVNNIISYSNILTAAVGSMGGRFITMQFYRNELDEANEYFNSVWIANCLLSVLFTIISIFAIIFITDILTVPQYLKHDVQWLFIFGSLSLVISLITGLLGIGTYVKNRLDLQAYVNVITNVVRVLCILLFFFIFKPTIIYMSLSAFIAALIGVYFNLSFKRRLLPELTINPQKYFSWKKVWTVTNSGIWNSLNQLSTVLLNQVDLLITNVFISAAATADYAMAKTAPTLILSLLAMLSSTFFPHFNILFAKNEMGKLIKSVSRSIKIVSYIIGIPMGFLLVFSDSFFSLWVPGQDSIKLYWLCFLTVAPLIIGASINPIYGLFTITNKLRVPSIVVLIGSSLQTLVILIVIKTTNLGIWSIPIVSAIQSVLRNTLFTTVYGGLCLGQKWNTFFPALFKGILCMMIVASIGLAIRFFITIENWFTFIAVLIIVSVLSLVINAFVVFEKSDRIFVFDKLKDRVNNLF
jgi:O-antigen/teichoic acid export membrane protein